MNEQTIYYGEDKNTISNITHLRDLEISIINYMLINVNNYKYIIPKLNQEYFTFASVRRIYNFLLKLNNSEKGISQKILNIVRKRYVNIIFDNNEDFYNDLNLANAVYIFNSKKSYNIELDLFELEEYYQVKNEVIKKNDSPLFTVIINSSDGETIVTYNDNRLIDVMTTNLQDLPIEIEDTFKNTMNNLMQYFNQEDSILNLLIDEQTKIPNGFSLKKEIKELEKIERFNHWLEEYNLINNINFKSFNFKHIPLINLSRKNIDYLPKEIEILRDLNLLELKDNKLTTIPSELLNLKKLSMLMLCNNNIKVIPRFLYEMEQLMLLCLHGNGFDEIKEDIVNLKNLRILTISKNKIKTLPNSLNKLLNLEELDIENNLYLENFDVEILKLVNLKKLCIDDRFLPIIVKNKNFFSKINSINLEYSSYKSNDDLIKLLNFKIVNEDWQIEEDDKYFGAVLLCLN